MTVMAVMPRNPAARDSGAGTPLPCFVRARGERPGLVHRIALTVLTVLTILTILTVTPHHPCGMRFR